MNRKIIALLKKSYLRIYGYFHKVEKKVLFCSCGGEQYSSDPRAISEKLHELYPEYRIVWKIKKEYKLINFIPKYVKVIESRLEFLHELATCAVFVTTDEFRPGIYKRKGQFFIQTWHADRSLKKILYEANPDGLIMDDIVTDLCVAGSGYGEKQYRNAFKYSGEILKIGMPRNDKLVQNSEMERQRIKEYFRINKDIRILTYAPTFRDNCNDIQNTTVNIESILSTLRIKTEDEWVCFVRAHAASKGLNIKCNKKIIDVSKYPDMADILLISDMLITDYSSCAGDFALRNKPIILALFDKEEYEMNCRTLLPVEQIGYFVAHNQKELEEIIKNKSDSDYRSRCNRALNYYDTVESGKASDEICHRIDEFYRDYYEKV